MIRYLGEDEREAIRALYEEAFDDTEAFVDYYLRSYVKGGSRCLVEEETGEVVSMISIHPKRWRLGSGECCEVWYLYGIATGKAYRRQGHMRRLMERVLADGRRKGIAYIYLIPESPEVYEGLGFRLVDKGMSACVEIEEGQSSEAQKRQEMGQPSEVQEQQEMRRSGEAQKRQETGRPSEVQEQQGMRQPSEVQEQQEMRQPSEVQEWQEMRRSGEAQKWQGQQIESAWVALTDIEERKASLGEADCMDIYAWLAGEYDMFCRSCGWDAYIEKDAVYFREQAVRARLEEGDIYLYYEKERLMAFATAGMHAGTCVVVECIGMEQAVRSEWNMGSGQCRSLLVLAGSMGAKRLQYQRFPVMIYAGTGAGALPNYLGNMDEV